MESEWIKKLTRVLPGRCELRLPLSSPLFRRRSRILRCTAARLLRQRSLLHYDEQEMKARGTKNTLTIFTIGHSTHTIEYFIELLHSNGVKQLIDIRTIPKSRHNPQFNSDALATSLRAARIRYVHSKGLGGLRHARRDSVNLGWRNASFRGYADYMQTPEFEAALDRAIELAEAHTAALMCAEAVPWRCHRSLVADALSVRGIRVLEIVSAVAPKEHKVTPFARVLATQIIDPADQPSLL
jgi:uncharacterized protein (DUF488 family)